MLGQSKAQAPVPPVPPPPPREVCCGFVWLILPEIFWATWRFTFPYVFYFFFASWFKMWKFFFFPSAWWFSCTILAVSAGCIGISLGPLQAMEKATGPGTSFSITESQKPIFLHSPKPQDLADPMAWPAWPWLRKSCTSKFMIPSSIWKNSGVAVVLVGEWSEIRWNFAERQFFQIHWGVLQTAKPVPLVWIIWNAHRQGVLYQKMMAVLRPPKTGFREVTFIHFFGLRLGAWDSEIIWNNVILMVSAKSPEINMVWLTSALSWISPWEIYHWLDVIKAANLRHFFIRTQGTLCTTTWLCFGFQKGNEACLVWFDGGHFQDFFFWIDGSLENWCITWRSEVSDYRCKHISIYVYVHEWICIWIMVEYLLYPRVLHICVGFCISMF